MCVFGHATYIKIRRGMFFICRYTQQRRLNLYQRQSFRTQCEFASTQIRLLPPYVSNIYRLMAHRQAAKYCQAHNRKIFLHKYIMFALQRIFMMYVLNHVDIYDRRYSQVRVGRHFVDTDKCHNRMKINSRGWCMISAYISNGIYLVPETYSEHIFVFIYAYPHLKILFF